MRKRDQLPDRIDIDREVVDDFDAMPCQAIVATCNVGQIPGSRQYTI